MLHIVMYHYVRDLERTRYPSIKGMLLSDFEQQARSLAGDFEMASLESALAYLAGRYRPRRELCLLTFDDGLKEHYEQVTPILSGLGIQGIFHVVTACLEEAGFVDTSAVEDGERMPARFQPLDGKGGGILSAMFLKEPAPGFLAADSPWYWTKSDSDQDRPN